MESQESGSRSPKKLNNQHTFQSKEDQDFYKTHTKLLYRTSANQVGSRSSIIKPETRFGMDGKFTTHLANATMYRNHSLSTTVDRDRYLNGCRDWELKLG